jgi:hypothetical protein
MHATIVLAHDIIDYAPLFAEIADAYFARGMYGDARPVYEALGSDATVWNSNFDDGFWTDGWSRRVVCMYSFRRQRVAGPLERTRKLPMCTSIVSI